MLDRKTAPQITDAVNFDLKLKPYSKFVLKNGVEVYTVHGGSQEVMQLEWLFEAGSLFEQKNGVAAAANFLIKNGTQHKTAFEINEAFEYYGAHCNRNCFTEMANITLHTLSRHLDKLLPVVKEMIAESIMPQEELSIYVQNSAQRLAVNLQKCEFVADREIDKLLYGADHPYGKFTGVEDLQALDREEILQFYQRHYQQGRCVIFAAGYLPNDLEARLNEHFGDLPLSAAVLKFSAQDAAAADKKHHRMTIDDKGVQGAVRLASDFPNQHHPDFKKARVLNTLFGGFFGSRLMANIREEKGYTYGIYSYLQNHMQQSAWMVATEAGKDVSEATVQEVFNEMKRLREEPVTEQELLLVKNFMMGSLLGDLDGPFHIIARWKNIIINGLPQSFFDDTIAEIRRATVQDMQEMASRYLLPERFYNLIVY